MPGTSPEPPRPDRAVAWWGRRRVIVHDESMRPTLAPGDRLYLDTRAYRSAGPRVGEIVVLADPEAPAQWLVKRIAAIGPRPEPDPDGGRIDPLPAGTVFVVSDARGPTRDSRRFGPVPIAALVGRVYYRYAPAERRGVV